MDERKERRPLKMRAAQLDDFRPFKVITTSVPLFRNETKEEKTAKLTVSSVSGECYICTHG